MDQNTGKVVQIVGPVLDIKFPKGHLPQLLNAVEVTYNGSKLVARLKLRWVTTRCVA